MGLEFRCGGMYHGQGPTVGGEAADGMAMALLALIALAPEGQFDLAAGHGEIDLGENLRIQHGAVQVATGVIDLVALAEGIEGVTLSRMAAARHRQAVDYPAQVTDTRGVRAPEL